jgi:hypothetical protein
VSCTKVRSPDGREFSFSTREEFAHAIRRVGITAQWTVLHLTTERWLPVTEHPVFRAQCGEPETVRRPDATEITATRVALCDHVPVIGTLEQCDVVSARPVAADCAGGAIPKQRGRFFLDLWTRHALMISCLLLLLAVGILGTSRLVGRSLERQLLQVRAGNSPAVTGAQNH